MQSSSRPPSATASASRGNPSRAPTPLASTSPVESLIFNIIPSLAPPVSSGRSRTNGSLGRGVGGTTGMAARLGVAEEIGEADRKEKVKELKDWCEVVIDRVSPTELDSSKLVTSARKSLLHPTQTAGPSKHPRTQPDTPAGRTAKFDELWRQLSGSKTLSDPTAHLRLLLALSPLNSHNQAETPHVNGVNGKAVSGLLDGVELQNGSAAVPMKMPRIDTTGKTRAEILGAWRKRQGTKPIPTELLLRDMLYLLQGIDGKHVRFAHKSQSQKNREANPYLYEMDFRGKGKGKGKEKTRRGAEDDVARLAEEEDITGLDYFLEDGDQEYHISTSLQSTMLVLSELGLLYRRVSAFAIRRQSRAGSRDEQGSMTELSLCHVLQKELSSYHALVSKLEAQIASMSSALPLQADSSSEGIIGDIIDTEESDAGMTFQSLSIYAADSVLRMRLMSALVGDAKEARGGALISAIHSHTSHGDPFIRDLTHQVSKPFFQTLQSWIIFGQLHDPFKEFFVQLNPEVAQKTLGRESPYGDGGFGDTDAFGGDLSEERNNVAHVLWEKKYVFVKEMLPSFLSEEFGRKIFSTGKSINFIRYSCHDSEWKSTQAQLATGARQFVHDDIVGLERTIDDAYSIASKRLLDIFFDKFNLQAHLEAMKKYILLTAGDFADVLLEAISPRLNKDAAKLLRHHLTSDVETAIDTSNAKYEPEEIIRRIDARILDPQQGDLGWDVFHLEYRVGAPINAVLDGKAMLDYYRLFTHLWRIRRVEAALKTRWMQITYSARKQFRLRGYARAWRRAHMLQAQMVHFMCEMQAYCQLEAIELSWLELLKFIQARKGDLDALIAEHRLYLRKVAGRVFLLNPREGPEESLLDIVKDAMEIIMMFGTVAESLYRVSFAESSRLDRLKEAELGIVTAQSRPEDPAKNINELERVEGQLMECSEDFRGKMLELVGGLETHPNYEVKFLAIRLSFNDFYSRRKTKSARVRQTTATT